MPGYRDPFYLAVEKLVKNRGEKAQKLWTVVSGFEPMVPPATALDSLKRLVDVVGVEFREEAKALIRDLENLFKSPPF